MKRISRARLRGKRLTSECYKAKICHDDFTIGDKTYDTCWGLIDPMTDDTWPECSVCNAFYLNAMELTIPKEGGDG